MTRVRMNRILAPVVDDVGHHAGGEKTVQQRVPWRRTPMIPRILTASALALVLTAAPRAAGSQEPAGFGDALRLLDAWVTTAVAQRDQPGVSIGVVSGDRLVWSRGYGYADIEKKVPASPQTLYRIASITKTFTAVAILQLRDAGKLQLDDPLRRHLGWARIRAHDPAASDITIRELLTHSSGLQREVPGTLWTSPAFPPAAALREEIEETILAGCHLEVLEPRICTSRRSCGRRQRRTVGPLCPASHPGCPWHDEHADHATCG